MARAGAPLPAPITCSGVAAALLAPGFRGLAHEQLCILHLDERLRPLGVKLATPGTTDMVRVPIRALVAEALRRDARKLILAHNHPAGDPQPSRADRDATRRLTDAFLPLGIAILDHLIFAAGRWVSFRAIGLL